ncbi:MAG TPA: fumarate hydratase [Dehalococcoidia bacterium]|nr:fumarate hydratase [Dehalococcoidia bacterium]
MREIEASAVTEAITDLFIQANYELTDDVISALKLARQQEESPAGREALDKILENASIAGEERVPLCQDCGTALVFIELGQDAHITGGDLYQAVNEGVRRAYVEGYLRKSMVEKPFSERTNTQDNTPAVIHTTVVPGNRLRIIALPKGAGSENMTRLGMLTPASGRQGVIDFVVKAVEEAGANPCPPGIIGVGIGGTAERTLLLAKQALLRKVGEPSLDSETSNLEKDILDKVNRLGIGPMGYGGRITALAVHIETSPAHIGSMPVAVSLQCHSARHREITL